MSDTMTHSDEVSDERLAEMLASARRLELSEWVSAWTELTAFRASRRSASNTAGGGDDDTEATWRDLALQFDGHRIDALSNLRYAVRCIEEYATVRDILREPLQTLKAFLAAPPLSGEKVLAARLSALEPIQAGGDEPVARPSYDAISAMVHACRDRQKQAGEGDQMLSRWISEGLDALYTRPATPVSAEVTEEVRGFLYALLGADTWLEAGAVWEQNPEQRKAAHDFLDRRAALATLDRGRG